MNVILDTNVLMSGMFFGGVPARLLAAWRQGAFQLIVSPSILDEYRRVATALHHTFPQLTIERTLDLIARHATLVQAPPLPHPVCTDPADDQFLAAALASRTRLIVSGDRQLLAASGYQRIRVLTPRRFYEQYLH